MGEKGFVLSTSHNTRLRRLIERTQKQLPLPPELWKIKVWHREYLSTLIEIYGETSPIIVEWRSIPMEWGMVVQGDWVDETFLATLDDEDQEYHQYDYEDYRNFCRGRLEIMKNFLLDCLSSPAEGATNVTKPENPRHIFPELAWIDKPELRRLCLQNLETARTCARQGSYLVGIVLVAGTMEGMLYSIADQRKDVWQSLPKKPKRDLFKWHLNDLITVASKVGWLPSETSAATFVTRIVSENRNLLHPAKQIHSNSQVGEHTFDTSWSVMRETAEGIKRWMDQDKVADSEVEE